MESFGAVRYFLVGFVTERQKRLEAVRRGQAGSGEVRWGEARQNWRDSDWWSWDRLWMGLDGIGRIGGEGFTVEFYGTAGFVLARSVKAEGE